MSAAVSRRLSGGMYDCTAKYVCPWCSEKDIYRMKIKKLPNILALHLKRFKYQEQLQKYIKLTYRVVFPFELRLFNTVSVYAPPLCN